MLDKARAQMRAGVRRVLLQLPTGGGKTVMAAKMLGGSSQRSLASMFMVHRKELLEQTSETFRTVDIPHGVIGAGFPEAPDRLVQLAGVQTLVRRLDRTFPPKMIVVDEAHHAVAGTWDKILSEYPDAYIIGLTATPERLDGRGLGSHFDVIVKGPSVAWLIEQGYLSSYDYFGPTVPDMGGVGVIGGDYNKKTAASIMDSPKIIGDVVQHYHRLAAGKQGIFFAAGVSNSLKMVDAFRGSGVDAVHLDGSMNRHDRKRAVDAFRAGDVRLLSNVDLFGEGFDVPGIEYLGMGRPSKSLSLVMQQWGRSLRVLPGKEKAIIADHAGNWVSHGFPDDERQWSLEGRKAREAGLQPSDAFAIRQCLECYMITRSTVSVCPGCGSVKVSKGRDLKNEAGELFQLDPATRKAREAEIKKKAADLRKQEERECKTYSDFLALGKRRGYEGAKGWALRKYQAKSNIKNRYRRKA